MSATVDPIIRSVFETQELVSEFPPRFSNRNKRVVHGISCPLGCTHSGQIVFSRWAKMDLPVTWDGRGSTIKFESREDFFGYEPAPEGSLMVEWYLNFAHFDLFCAYGGGLFAQDEMQVTEHPALGSLREALLQLDIKPFTVEQHEPTPILIMGVERRCQVDTSRNALSGRPHGLYGNNFASASIDTVVRATHVINPPTISNILAMEAPSGGFGRYSRKDIAYILNTAYTGFAAARFESCRDRVSPPEVVVHTGFWGCGAYGGNRILMVLLQLLAAQLAGLDRLVFHTGDSSGSPQFLEANRILQQDLGGNSQPRDVANLVTQIESMGWPWGVSDGN